MQKARTGAHATVVGGRIHVVGGATEPSLAGITGMVEELTIGETN